MSQRLVDSNSWLQLANLYSSNAVLEYPPPSHHSPDSNKKVVTFLTELKMLSSSTKFSSRKSLQQNLEVDNSGITILMGTDTISGYLNNGSVCTFSYDKHIVQGFDLFSKLITYEFQIFDYLKVVNNYLKCNTLFDSNMRYKAVADVFSSERNIWALADLLTAQNTLMSEIASNADSFTYLKKSKLSKHLDALSNALNLVSAPGQFISLSNHNPTEILGTLVGDDYTVLSTLTTYNYHGLHTYETTQNIGNSTVTFNSTVACTGTVEINFLTEFYDNGHGNGKHKAQLEIAGVIPVLDTASYWNSINSCNSDGTSASAHNALVAYQKVVNTLIQDSLKGFTK